MDSALEIPQLTRTEEYDDPAVLTMPDHSWLARTTADMCDRPQAEEINDKAYWADVFGNNWDAKAPDKENNKERAEKQFQAMLDSGFTGPFTVRDIQAAMDHQDEDAAYWAEIFGDWGEEEDWDPLDYDDDAGEVYDMLLLE